MFIWSSVAVLFASVVLAGTETCDNYNPCAFKGNEVLRHAGILRSRNGRLKVTLKIEMSLVKMEWFETWRRTYNGLTHPQTWVLRRGDAFHLTIINNLGYPNPGESYNTNFYRFPNTTNIHTHGLHVESKDPQDNVFRHIEPNQTQEYKYDIAKNQPSGTYWYHPHFHGATALQSNGGMSGAIIIEDEELSTPSYLWKISCPLHCQHDVTLMLQPILVYRDSNARGYSTLQRINNDDSRFRLNRFVLKSGENLESYAERNIRYYTTNGQLWPVHTVKIGQWTRFRLINGGGNDLLVIKMYTEDGDALKMNDSQCKVLVIANDGIYLDRPQRLRYGKVSIPPGGRADLIIKCYMSGSYQVRAVEYEQYESASYGGFSTYAGLLLRLDAVGKDLIDDDVTHDGVTSIKLPMRPHYLRDLSEAHVDSRFMVELSSDLRINRERFKSEVDYKYSCEVGTVQEWFLVNTAVDASHPIHMHVNSFQVIGYNKFLGPVNSVKSNAYFNLDNLTEICDKQYQNFQIDQYHIPPTRDELSYYGHERRHEEGGPESVGYVYGKPFRDVIIVQPLSNITIRFVTDQFTGCVLVHCHVVMHEDEGMMFTYHVVDQGEPLMANIADVNGVYPGQCGKSDAYPFTKMRRICKRKNKKLQFLKILIPQRLARQQKNSLNQRVNEFQKH